MQAAQVTPLRAVTTLEKFYQPKPRFVLFVLRLIRITRVFHPSLPGSVLRRETDLTISPLSFKPSPQCSALRDRPEWRKCHQTS